MNNKHIEYGYVLQNHGQTYVNYGKHENCNGSISYSLHMLLNKHSKF